jgi:transposase
MKKRQTPAPTVQAIHDAARVRITPLSVEEVAQRTGVSKFTVRGWNSGSQARVVQGWTARDRR